MTTQYAVLPARSGRSYTAKVFTVADPDTEVTGNTITVTERTNAKGMFRASIVRATALPAGDYILVYLYGTLGAAVGYFTFAGTDGETATETPPTVELDSSSRAAILTQEIVESYPADAAAPTLAQAVMLTLQHLQQKSVSGTTVTIKKLDKSTTAATYTLDSATDPTSITRAS